MNKRPTDVEFIQNPRLWPNWPFLPVKKYAKSEGGVTLHTGIIHTRMGLSTVYIGNLFSLPTSEEGFRALKNHTYVSVEEMLADGWIID